MTANVPIPPMLKRNPDGTATCPGTEAICFGSMANVRAPDSMSPDGGSMAGEEVVRNTPYHIALKEGAAKLKRTWQEIEADVKPVFEEQFAKDIARRSRTERYQLTLALSYDLEDVTLLMAWEPNGTKDHHWIDLKAKADFEAKVKPTGLRAFFAWFGRLFTPSRSHSH